MPSRAAAEMGCGNAGQRVRRSAEDARSATRGGCLARLHGASPLPTTGKGRARVRAGEVRPKGTWTENRQRRELRLVVRAEDGERDGRDELGWTRTWTKVLGLALCGGRRRLELRVLRKSGFFQTRRSVYNFVKGEMRSPSNRMNSWLQVVFASIDAPCF